MLQRRGCGVQLWGGLEKELHICFLQANKFERISLTSLSFPICYNDFLNHKADMTVQALGQKMLPGVQPRPLPPQESYSHTHHQGPELDRWVEKAVNPTVLQITMTTYTVQIYPITWLSWDDNFSIPYFGHESSLLELE
jgi:hypothetical protein